MAKDTFIKLRCTNEFKAQIEALAMDKGLTVSSYIQMLLTEQINNSKLEVEKHD